LKKQKLSENSIDVLKKLKTELSYDLANPLLAGYMSKGRKEVLHNIFF
jgi:hypothetical protein